MNNGNPRFSEASAATSLKREIRRKTGNAASTSFSQSANEWRRTIILSSFYTILNETTQYWFKENINSATYNGSFSFCSCDSL